MPRALQAWTSRAGIGRALWVQRMCRKRTVFNCLAGYVEATDIARHAARINAPRHTSDKQEHQGGQKCGPGKAVVRTKSRLSGRPPGPAQQEPLDNHVAS